MTVRCFVSVFLFVLYFFPLSYSGTESPATAVSRFIVIFFSPPFTTRWQRFPSIPLHPNLHVLFRILAIFSFSCKIYFMVILFQGTFKTSVVSVNDCRNPSRPYLKNPPMIFIPKIENVDGRNMLGGNLTILRDTKDVKVRHR